MARSRNIKPGFYKNEELAECTIWTRFIYPGLWQLADREGRLEDRPKRIKGELLPFDHVDVEPLLVELAARKFILRYEVAGRRYIQILAFERHQNPHHREPPSIIPAPEASPGLEPPAKAPKPGADTSSNGGKAQGSPKSGPADSGFLIPDSGDKPIVGLKPDGVLPGETPKAKARRDARSTGIRAIAYLNAKAGTRFQPTEANLRFPMGRTLYDNATEADLLAVVDLKVAEAGKGEFDRKYLRPATLWNAEKFSQYSGQISLTTAPALKLEVKAYAERADGSTELITTYQAAGLQPEAAARQVLEQHRMRFFEARAKNVLLDNGRGQARFSIAELGSAR